MTPTGRASPRQTHRPLTVVALLLALFMAAMEMTVVSTAMPTVVGELGGALHYAWVFSAYMLTSTVMVPIHGKLADLYGRKPVMLASMGAFLLGSMASGQASSMTALIVFRAIQGVGAGGLQPIALTIIGDVFDLEERARMQGIFGAVWGIAGLAGPLLGGLIVAALSWRWVFYVNVPFGLLSALVLSFSLVDPIDRRADHTLDVLGATLLSAAIVSLLIGVEGVLPWLTLPASALLTLGFVAAERRAKEPILPPHLFARRLLAASSALSAVAGAAMIGIVTFLPLYAQGVLGSTATEAGATIAPMAVGWPLASAISGRLIPRFGFRPLVRTGAVIVAIATAALALLVTQGATSAPLRIAAAAFGVGMGVANTALVIAVQTSVGFQERGVATASTMFFRSIGGTLGVGVMGVVLARSLAATSQDRGAGSDLVATLLGPERASVAPEMLARVSTGLTVGISQVLWLSVGLGLVAVVSAWLFPDVDHARRAPSP